jgi:hypothetical protein
VLRHLYYHQPREIITFVNSKRRERREKGKSIMKKTFSQNLRHGFGSLDEYFVAGLQN